MGLILGWGWYRGILEDYDEIRGRIGPTSLGSCPKLDSRTDHPTRISKLPSPKPQTWSPEASNPAYNLRTQARLHPVYLPAPGGPGSLIPGIEKATVGGPTAGRGAARKPRRALEASA